MGNLIKTPKRGGHFKDLKEKIFASLETLDSTHSIKEEPEGNSGKMVKNLNEFLNLNRNKFKKDGPKITLTKSSLDESESSQNCSSARLSSSTTYEDSLNDSSPDDSQEYFPMTTSVTRDLKAEIESLDRKVFGNGRVEKPKVIKNDEIFVWENPLHQTSPNTHTKPLQNFIETPDEQADIELDAELAEVIEEKLPSSPKNLPVKLESENGAKLVYEEMTEIRALSLLPPPNEFGGGNPFLMFLCITVLLQHREQIMSKGMDYNEMAMHFDKMVRKHNVNKVLNQARQMYARYIKQHTIAQQKLLPSEHHRC